MTQPPTANPRSAYSLRPALGALLALVTLLVLMYANMQHHVHQLPRVEWLAALTF